MESEYLHVGELPPRIDNSQFTTHESDRSIVVVGQYRVSRARSKGMRFVGRLLDWTRRSKVARL